MEPTTPAGQPIVDREKTAPFLIRAFVKVGGFHRLAQFQEGPIPVADEQQIFTWKDATLLEVLTTLRVTGPQTPEYRHPLARYSFRAVYADAANRGSFAQKDLGIVYSRDILGEPGTLDTTAPRLLQDTDDDQSSTERQKEARTLEELRFVPGDYLCIAVLLPKNVPLAAGPPGTTGELSIKGSAPAVPNGWRTAGPTSVGRGGASGGGPGPGVGRGGGHWRGESNAPSSAVRGRGGRGETGGRDRDADRLRDDRRPPPPRRGDSPPPRSGGWGERGRGFKDRRSRSRSRSRSPPRRRR
ncbi:hypothetical protein BV25DRAFT_1868581 [Artomyces pyxidatus]|uniref:Uncharacterized protein n=1 Tax=Artomyces pyxidatus TaxID=48021 RepID=A0ACB8TBD7_9AGAM|nr:hypothetical protein BV25DRAFT_1868581 [Artomyces pyxidatus]